MADPTTNYAWDLPTVNGATNTWGTQLNTIFQDIDDDLKAAEVTAAAALDALGDQVSEARLIQAAEGSWATLSYAQTAIQTGFIVNRALLSVVDALIIQELTVGFLLPLSGLRTGWTITDWETYAFSDAGTRTVSLVHFQKDGTTVTIGSPQTLPTSAGTVLVGSVGHVVLADRAYALKYDLGVLYPDSATIYSAKVTATRP